MESDRFRGRRGAAPHLDVVPPVPPVAARRASGFSHRRNRDIGTAICLRLADAGFSVIATYPRHESAAARQWQAARRRAGYELGIVACDVARCDDCASMASWIEGHYGHVDILVNCVGITRDDRKQENWQTVLDTNLDSVFNVTRTVIAAMAERHFGRIINISSVNGPPGQFGQTDVAAARAGMLGFTKSLARELADQGITVNTVSPGHGEGMVAEIPDEIRKAIKAKLAKGRWGEPEEIAAAVDFLAADTSGYITGTDIAVNGPAEDKGSLKAACPLARSRRRVRINALRRKPSGLVTFVAAPSWSGVRSPARPRPRRRSVRRSLQKRSRLATSLRR